MRLVSLEPYITELLLFFGERKNIVGISSRCRLAPEEGQQLAVVTVPKGGSSGPSVYHNVMLSRESLDLAALKAAKPEVVIASLVSSVPGEEPLQGELLGLQEELSGKIGNPIKLYTYNPTRLEEIFEDSDRLARQIKVTDRGSSIGKRAKAQLMDWGANFYDRMKNKKVTVIASVEPLHLGGLWIPDMVHALSAVSQSKQGSVIHPAVSWREIVEFRPDVIVVAPIGAALKEAMAQFKIMEKWEGWETIPAVKRGEVVFCDGIDHFYNPGPKIIDSFGVMVSAIAGFESGYITKRDIFHRLRWLELQRHKL
ncbi:MAG: ABC transporter substrate-binding protein [Deltaproteobacteria bacterium]|nr:ABC transporter substrate-binding protein [Deltaproteobacteria bacterium]